MGEKPVALVPAFALFLLLRIAQKMIEKSQDTPLVSICIPTYNAAAFLAPCLQSAAAQTYPRIEILISDDGSTDNTVAIVQQYQRQHPHIRLVQNSANAGMVANWNRCIALASGEWIKFLFQDDLLEPGCVEAMLRQCHEKRVSVAVCHRQFVLHDDVLPHVRRFFAEAPTTLSVFEHSGLIAPLQLAKHIKQHLTLNFLGEPTCSFFSKAFVLQTGGFNGQLQQLVDYELIARLGLQQGLAFLAEPLAAFRVHGSSQSSANAGQDKAVRLRAVKADTGDAIYLLYLYLHHPAFRLVKKTAGTELLTTYINQLYYTACKRHGEKLVNEGLAYIQNDFPDFSRMRYNFFKYVLYRRRMKKILQLLAAEKIQKG